MLVAQVNSKREVLAASLLAIALAAGLGTLSYGFFSQTPPNVRIDVFSMKNGAASASFLPSDQVSLEAQLSHDDASIAGAPVTFEAIMPNGTILPSKEVLTDKLGIANLTFNLTFSMPTPMTDSLGKWQAKASVTAYGQTVNATTYFYCQLITPMIDIFTPEGGRGQNMPGGTFTLNSTVTFYAEIRDSLNQTVPNNLVAFEVKPLNPTSAWNWTAVVHTTNATGIATASTWIRADPLLVQTWEAYATTQYNDNILIDTLIFQTVMP